MISHLDISNFKCFAQLRIGFGALTLLTGFNAGGKSSATQPLLLLSQGFRRSASINRLNLNGELVRLGAAGDVLPAGTNDSNITFAVESKVGKAIWRFSARAGDRHISLIDCKCVRPSSGAEYVGTEVSGISDKLRSLSCISAIREGAADSFPFPDDVEDGVVDVGFDGRYASYWYEKFVDEEVARSRRHPSESASTFRKQADAWFSTLFPNAQVNVQQLSQVSLESLQFRMTEIGDWRRPANVGYGFTYAFPILVALLIAKEGQVLVIDSPEAHLHPSAQSQMGRMLAHFAAAGVQLVVETHSDHLLNGARLAVKEGTLAPSDLVIHFFTGANSTDHGVVSPTTDGDGRLSDWPDGFFDQTEKDLGQLSGWE